MWDLIILLPSDCFSFYFAGLAHYLPFTIPKSVLYFNLFSDVTGTVCHLIFSALRLIVIIYFEQVC